MKALLASGLCKSTRRASSFRRRLLWGRAVRVRLAIWEMLDVYTKVAADFSAPPPLAELPVRGLPPAYQGVASAGGLLTLLPIACCPASADALN